MKKILYTILSLLAIILILLIYARFIGTQGLTTNEIPYNTEYISNSYNGLKIIHFTDLHYKKVITEKRVKNLVKEINKTKPDLVLFTGDLLDNDYTLKGNDISFLIKQLSKIDSKYGKFAILGDNDYLKTDTVKNIYIQSNFTLLENNYSIIHNENNDLIFIGGLSTFNYDEANIETTMNYFNTNPDIPFKIILTHEPDYIDEILNKYPNIPLILSGHSINGSINIPLLKKFITPTGAKKYYNPYYHNNTTDIYISNGIGLNNINFRLFNHPSINLYRINTTKKPET